MKYKKIFLLIFLWLSFFWLKNVHAQSKESVGVISNVIGKVEVIRDGKNVKAEKEIPIYETDKIITHENSAIKINFKDGSNYMGFADTEFKVSEYKIKQNKKGGVNLKSAIDIVKGSIHFFVKPKDDGANDSQVNTPNSVMLIRGTEGNALYDEITKESVFSLLQGLAYIANKNNPGILRELSKNFKVTVQQNLIPGKAVKIDPDQEKGQNNNLKNNLEENGKTEPQQEQKLDQKNGDLKDSKSSNDKSNNPNVYTTDGSQQLQTIIPIGSSNMSPSILQSTNTAATVNKTVGSTSAIVTNAQNDNLKLLDTAHKYITIFINPTP